MALKPTMVYLTMKGGVGKTTLAANVTRAIADLDKKKILLIDADSQCNLTQLFVDPEEFDQTTGRSIYDALDGTNAGRAISRQKSTPTRSTAARSISFEGLQSSASATTSPLVRKRQCNASPSSSDRRRPSTTSSWMDTNPSATLVTMQALAVFEFSGGAHQLR